MVRSDPPSSRHLCTPYTLQYPVSKTLDELTAFNSRVGRACMARPLYDRGSTARGDDIRPDVCRDQLKTRLYDVRNSHTVERARAMQNATKSFPSYTVMESATGGCLDTLAASFAQFRHLGGSEDVSNPLGKAKASLFEYITQAKCHGDMLDYPNWLRTIREAVHYYKSGTPCTDFAVLGSQKGATGPTGALFLAQMLLIQRIMPAIQPLPLL